MRTLGVIPARYASTRYPGKPLVTIAGKSMLQRVFAQARQATALTDVVIATDDSRIFAHAQSFGAQVWMTRADHPSGTDRLLEVATRMPGYDAYLNIQGDEPFVQPAQLTQLVSLLSADDTYAVRIATLVRRITSAEELLNPNAVKAVLGAGGRALYFSRQPVPYLRAMQDTTTWPAAHPYWKHLGLYGFTAAALAAIRPLVPSKLEQAESLEQLRWLEAGLPIFCAETDHQSPAIDTPTDLAYVLQLIASGTLRA
jgi:3-deoxy-manno-octulosonate cytidylyltransferase (CMP-KDO synthetase)